MPEQSVAAKSLVSKLAAACNAVGGVEKKGRNTFQKYDYVRASDVAKAIRRELFKRGVILIADQKSFEQIGEIPTNGGGMLREFKLTLDYVLHDADSDEKITVQAFGVAMDTGDKALWKCLTGAQKYFLRGLGLIPDEKDDPEADESVDEATYEVEFNKRTKGQKKITDIQRRILNAAFDNHGKTPAMVSAYLEAEKKVPAITDLMFDDFNDVIAWASSDCSEANLAATAKTSIKAVEIRKSRKGPQPVVKIAEQPRPDEITGD